MIADYTNISVRESDVSLQLNGITNLPTVCSCLDPVFLFTVDQWREFSSFENREPYLLFFIVGKGDDAIPALHFSCKFAKEKGLKVVFLSDNERWYKFRELKHFGVATPSEFVGLIENAEYVITNSFHATAFSIIFHRTFFVETGIKRSNRILNLLDICGLQQCSLVNGQPSKFITDIDWEYVDEKLEKLVCDSYSYLDDIVSKILE